MSFCADTYGVSFPQFAKIEVNGPNESPLYTYLKENKIVLYQNESTGTSQNF